MANRPSVYPEWATSLLNDGPLGGANIVEPGGSDKQSGFTFPQKPPREWFNWLFNMNYQWITYLDQEVKYGGQSSFAHDATTTSGLTFGYKAGAYHNLEAGTITASAASIISLTNDTTNYIIYRPGTGVMKLTSASFAESDTLLWKVVTAGGAISSIQDLRDVATANIPYERIQNVSATDRLLGRSTAGAGTIEEITCTAAGRAILDDATAGDQRTTLGAAASGAVTSSGITMATARLLGRTTAGTGAIEEITVGAGLTFSAGSLSVSASTSAFASAAQTSGQSIPDATVTSLIFDTEQYDTSSSYDAVTGIFTAPSAGKYHISAMAGLSSTTLLVTQVFYISIYVNGSEIARGMKVQSDNNVDPTSSVVRDLSLALNDQVVIRAYQTSGGAANTVGSAATCYLSIAQFA